MEEGAGLLELQCTFFGEILVGRNCCWVVILGSQCVKICQRLTCWERGVQCVDSFAGREEFSVWVARAGTWTTRETPWKQNGLPSMVNIMQIALAKSWSVSGASHQPAS